MHASNMVLGQVLTFSACHTIEQIASEPLDRPQTLYEWLTTPVRQLRLLELRCGVEACHKGNQYRCCSFLPLCFLCFDKGCSWSSQKVIMM